MGHDERVTIDVLATTARPALDVCMFIVRCMAKPHVHIHTSNPFLQLILCLNTLLDAGTQWAGGKFCSCACVCRLERVRQARHTVRQQILTVGPSNIVGRLEGASDDEAQRHEQVVHEWNVHLARMLQASTLLLSTPSGVSLLLVYHRHVDLTGMHARPCHDKIVKSASAGLLAFLHLSITLRYSMKLALKPVSAAMRIYEAGSHIT